jgi:hypothetical protein
VRGLRPLAHSRDVGGAEELRHDGVAAGRHAGDERRDGVRGGYERGGAGLHYGAPQSIGILPTGVPRRPPARRGFSAWIANGIGRGIGSSWAGGRLS